MQNYPIAKDPNMLIEEIWKSFDKENICGNYHKRLQVVVANSSSIEDWRTPQNTSTAMC
jgi:hypothetical protein